MKCKAGLCRLGGGAMKIILIFTEFYDIRWLGWNLVPYSGEQGGIWYAVSIVCGMVSQTAAF